MNESVIRSKVAAGEVDFTVHAVFEAASDLIFIEEVEQALPTGRIIEDDVERFRCVVRCMDRDRALIHVVLEYRDWSTDAACPLTAVTVYRPDPAIWIDGRIRRS